MNKSDYFILGAALVSLVFSVLLRFGALGRDAEANRQAALFVGLWLPSILALGC